MSFVSTFEMFKIGPGPSSSHTYGPMVAAAEFLNLIREQKGLPEDSRVKVTLYGSLSSTGKGHWTDKAVAWGLLGFKPDEMDGSAEKTEALERDKRIALEDTPAFQFDPENDVIWDDEALPEHPNGMVFSLADPNGEEIVSETYFSVGGGFVETKAELAQENSAPEISSNDNQQKALPYQFNNVSGMLEIAARTGLTIAEMRRENELIFRTKNEISDGIKHIWDAMDNCISRGLATEGTLPGGMGAHGKDLRRLAKIVHEGTLGENNPRPSKMVAIYARSIQEENAAGGQVVTAPTNGAAGIVPAILRYYLNDTQQGINTLGDEKARAQIIQDYLFTAAAIGEIIKNNAFISGAAGGCQAEVGSASAMAAAGLAALLGATPKQATKAASAALEAHLGLTCDPPKGLVQVPCIRRNINGAPKALMAGEEAAAGEVDEVIPLDDCIKVMFETGQDMDSKYKETATGGLALHHPGCHC